MSRNCVVLCLMRMYIYRVVVIAWLQCIQYCIQERNSVSELNCNEDHISNFVRFGSYHWNWYALLFNCSLWSTIFFKRLLCFLHKFLFVAETEGPMKLVEGKICDLKLYNYCDEDCSTDCPKMFGPNAIGFCNFNPQVCICRRQC